MMEWWDKKEKEVLNERKKKGRKKDMERKRRGIKRVECPKINANLFDSLLTFVSDQKWSRMN